jgi:hypothetical protein
LVVRGFGKESVNKKPKGIQPFGFFFLHSNAVTFHFSDPRGSGLGLTRRLHCSSAAEGSLMERGLTLASLAFPFCDIA